MGNGISSRAMRQIEARPTTGTQGLLVDARLFNNITLLSLFPFDVNLARLGPDSTRSAHPAWPQRVRVITLVTVGKH